MPRPDLRFLSGKFVDPFKADLAACTGGECGVAMVNGTAALQVAQRVTGVRHGDEVASPRANLCRHGQRRRLLATLRASGFIAAEAFQLLRERQ